MKIQTILLACFTAGALLLTGCSNNAQTGALVGSLVGAGLGKATSNHRDKRAVIGGVLGGLVGSAIGAEKDRANYNRSANYQGGTYTTPYYQNGTSGKTVTQHPNVSHKHGNRTHTHPGGSGNHQHNYNQQTAQSGQNVVRETEYVYVDRPRVYYPPVTTSIILGAGYYGGYRRGYNKRYNRHNRRRHNHRNYNRHRNHTRRH